jgi:two-component system response regulator YesN
MSIIGRRFRELDFDRQAVAEELCLSADYLGWLMKRYLGYGLINHLHVVRVAEAARLLQETHASVYAIARDCGYHTTAELDMHFKRRHGCTPTEFRLRRS